ncbi:hypothetical protein [Campylobacter rectus]|uniref:hypothetical protein n=1 Tax=Campylobacter rectus TaxID=203 RepID=UPI0023F2A90F|nr:hypothetical protein [Campylobacter rectus]
MKNIGFVLLALITLSSGLFANFNDPYGLSHPIQWIQTGSGHDDGVYADIKEGMTRRPILDKDGKEIKRIYGDMDIIGATISVPSGTDKWGSTGYNYWPITGKLWKGTLTYIRGVNDAGYEYNSAYSTFDFSSKPTELERNHIDGSKVIYARLYWAGGLSNPWNDHPGKNVDGLRNKYFAEINGLRNVRFGTPDGKSHYLTANPSDIYWWGSYAWVNNGSQGGMYFMYQASADVTNLVKASLTKDKRRFSAGNIKSSTSAPGWMSMYRDGEFKSGRYYLAPHYGGWALLIVYDFGEDQSDHIKPRSVNIYDGLRVLDPSVRGGSGSKSKNLELEFKGFYTPPSGPVNSTLAIMSFGGKKEAGNEDVQVWHDNKYESVTSGKDTPADKWSKNDKGNQFNSTITKFGSNINPGQTYNNQMDLDVFDISGKIGNAQTSAWINLIATSGWISGILYSERANVGLVAFSTELYSPEVCYEETLFTKDKDAPDSAFTEVSTNKNSYTKVQKDSILRVQVAIKNKGNESAQRLTLTSSLNQKGSEYKPNTTYIVTSEPISTTNFRVGSHNPDNTAFQASSKNLLTFAIGDGAGHIGSANQGGTIDKTNQAFIQYDATLKQIDKFQANIYRASFTNSALNLSFDGKIKRCDNKEYYLTVFDKPNINNFRAVNKNFTQDGDSQNLYTQIANRKFDIKIAHFGKETASGNQLSKTDIDTTVGVDIVTTCAAGGVSALKQPMEVEFKKGENGKAIVDLKDVLIEKAYSNLYVKLSFTDPITKAVKTNCASDTFTVRPKEFKIYDNSTNSEIINRVLIGGKSYPTFGARAMDDKNDKAEGYTTLLPDSTEKSYAKFIPEKPATCTSVGSLPVTMLKADFTDGVAKLERYREGATPITDKRDFAYYEVGKAKLVIFDNKWTVASHDQKNGDCIADNYSSTEINGKVGCNIRSEFDFEFNPQDIHVENLRVTGFNGGAMTYMSNEIAMSARATFDVKARLGDTDRTVARMYTKDCYSKDAQFEMDVDAGIADLNDKDNTKTPNPSDAKSKIIFFYDSANTLVTKKVTASNNSGLYNVSKDAFINGEIRADVKFNFARKATEPLDPFTVNSNIFTFKNVKEQSSSATVTNTYVKPKVADETNTQFYYGIVYAPNYEGPKTGFEADVYFGVYCKKCVKNTYIVAKGRSLPDAANWYLNESHIDSSYGLVNEYKPQSTSVSLTPKDISNGVQTLTLSDTKAETTDIEMVASKWLIYNKTNNLAASNKFSVTFFDRPKWGGEARDKDGSKLNDPGKVLDSEDGDLDGYSKKTNKRSDW